jgi:hypothetical protein
MAISRRYLLQHTFTLAGAAGAFSLPPVARAQTKASQKLVAYQSTPKEGHSCANCQYFQPPNGCKVVEGPISSAGWCSLWAQKS